MQPKKPKKKRGPGTRIFIAIFLVGIVFVLYLIYAQQAPPSSITSSQISSITTPSLSPDDFSIVWTAYACTNGNNGLKSVTVNTQLQNQKNIAFHYISAEIVFANYTLANGTVVQVNEQWADNNRTFGTTHTFNLAFNSQVLNSGPKITQVEFIIAADVQEVGQPIIGLVTTPVGC